VSPPEIDGVPVEYATLTAVPGVATGTAPISRSYRWLMDGVEVGTGTTYVVTAADAGAVPTLEETLTNAAGSTSDESAPLLAVWRPSELGTRLRAWIDAAEVTLVGSDIDAFDDLAGAGNVFVAPAPANRPAQTANFNGSGRPCATFSGSDEYVTETTFDWGESPLAAGASEVFVMRLPTNLSGNRFCVYGTTNLGMRETSSFRMQWRGTTTTALNQPTNALQNARVVTGEWDGPAGAYQIATGGLAVVTGTQTAAQTLTNNQQMWLGGTNVTADSNCEVAEALFVRGPLSDLELAQVEAYARAKFSVPAIVEPAFTTAPSFTGKPLVGETLTAVSGTRTGATGLAITDTFRWFVNGVEVATGATYVVQPADEGGLVTLRQRSSNSMGFSDSDESDAVLIVETETLGIEGFSIANYYERSGTLEAARTGDITHIVVFEQTTSFGSSQQTISSQNNSYSASAPGWYFWQDGSVAYAYVSGCGNANGVVVASRTAEDIGKAHAMGVIYGPADDTAQAISDWRPGDWLAFSAYTAPATSVPRRMGLLGSTANALTAGRYLGEIVVDGLLAGDDLIAWWRACREAGRVVAPAGYTLLEHVDVSTDLVAGVAPATFTPTIGPDFTLVGSLSVVSAVEGLTWDMPADVVAEPATPVVSAPASPSWTGTAKVMLAGDSLIAGVPAQPNGPRQQIYDRLTAQGAVDFVGSQTPPSATVPDNHCSAIAGDTTDQIFDRLDSDVPTYTPDVLSVGFGANDFGGAAELDVALRRARTSLLAFRASYPDMAIVLHEHGPWSDSVAFSGSTRNGNRCRLAWNDCVRRLATEIGGPTYVAAVESAYTSADLIDNIHPNGVGNPLMGDALADAILTALNGGAF